MRFRWLVAVLCMAALAFVVTACGGGGDSDGDTNTNATVKTGGVLRIGMIEKPSTFNPFLVSAYVDYQLLPLLNPMLVQASADGEIEPDLATSWEASDDGLTWTFQLASGAIWSDGQPITAADAAFTLNTVKKYSDSTAAGFGYVVENMDKAEAQGDTTLVVTFDKPSAAFLGSLAGQFIVPEHVFAKYAKDKDGKALSEFANDPPVTGGPFTFKQRQGDEAVLFDANADFYAEKPKIDGFGVRSYTNDDALLAALQANEIDVADNLASTAVNAVSGNDALQLTSSPGGSVNLLEINLKEDRTVSRELLNPKVREALDHAIDRDRIVDVAYFGHAQAGGAFMPPGITAWANDSIEPTTFDVDEANSILDELGYKKGSDGIRVADGERMSYEVLVYQPSEATDGRIAQIMKGDFADIGVELKPKVTDGAKFIDEVTRNDGKESTLYILNAGGTYDPQYLLRIFTCENRRSAGGFNSEEYCNPAYDKLFAEQSTTIDQDARKAIVDDMSQILADDRPVLPLAYREWLTAYTKKWAGFETSVYGVLNFFNHHTMVEVHQAS